LICNADGSSCWMNEAAEHLLVQRGVLWLSSDRQLSTRSTKETTQLRQMIASAARDQPDEPHVLVLRNNGRDALQVRCHGLQHESSFLAADTDFEGRVLVVLRDPSSDSSLPPDMLRKLFGLSPAESRLAAALCVGATLNEYATQAGVAIGTARYQLKQVMAKTQVSKQSQLVLRLCTSVISGMRN
jgi:DNA-binding CsgD family transcriptional regulator